MTDNQYAITPQVRKAHTPSDIMDLIGTHFNSSENSTSTDSAKEASDPCGATRLAWQSDSDSNALVNNPASSTAKPPYVEGGQTAMVERQ
jgi:hypothetical protein